MFVTVYQLHYKNSNLNKIKVDVKRQVNGTLRLTQGKIYNIYIYIVFIVAF